MEKKKGDKMYRPVLGINKPFVSPQVSIVWPNQHTSVFDAEWLKKRCFSPAARQAMQEELFLNSKSTFYGQNLIFYICL